MTWPDEYACAPGLAGDAGAFSVRPIRWEDREPIRRWRNEQIDVLRQVEPLTVEGQDSYFTDVVLPQLSQAAPAQVLLGFLEDGRLVGYGGVVHLCWPDRRGEISFLTPAERASGTQLRTDWLAFLSIVAPLCRTVLGLHKVTTETFEFRPELRSHLEEFGFREEGVLVDHHLVDGAWVTSYAHGLLLD
jgi:RimJ/RimL family protein N-acetyltransferase